MANWSRPPQPHPIVVWIMINFVIDLVICLIGMPQSHRSVKPSLGLSLVSVSLSLKNFKVFVILETFFNYTFLSEIFTSFACLWLQFREIGYEVNFVSLASITFFGVFGQRVFLEKIVTANDPDTLEAWFLRIPLSPIMLFFHLFWNNSWSLHVGNVCDVHRRVVVFVDCKHTKNVLFKFITSFNSFDDCVLQAADVMLLFLGGKLSRAWCKMCSFIIIIFHYHRHKIKQTSTLKSAFSVLTLEFNGKKRFSLSNMSHLMLE